MSLCVRVDNQIMKIFQHWLLIIWLTSNQVEWKIRHNRLLLLNDDSSCMNYSASNLCIYPPALKWSSHLIHWQQDTQRSSCKTLALLLTRNKTYRCSARVASIPCCIPSAINRQIIANSTVSLLAVPVWIHTEKTYSEIFRYYYYDSCRNEYYSSLVSSIQWFVYSHAHSAL